MAIQANSSAQVWRVLYALHIYRTYHQHRQAICLSKTIDLFANLSTLHSVPERELALF